MTTVAFIYKLHGPVFHVGRKYANLITKPTFYYIHLRFLRRYRFICLWIYITDQSINSELHRAQSTRLLCWWLQSARMSEDLNHLTSNLALLYSVSRERPVAISA